MSDLRKSEKSGNFDPSKFQYEEFVERISKFYENLRYVLSVYEYDYDRCLKTWYLPFTDCNTQYQVSIYYTTSQKFDGKIDPRDIYICRLHLLSREFVTLILDDMNKKMKSTDCHLKYEMICFINNQISCNQIFGWDES